MNQEGIEIEILLDNLSDDDEDFKAQQGKKTTSDKIQSLQWTLSFNKVEIIPCEKIYILFSNEVYCTCNS